ncbi:hypothetical protein C8T65DRAFT_817778 [Cerioporus squamosus]|nr:hypothetical protein C8T65DRAFT_817778 [Cerioporus squamosus]
MSMWTIHHDAEHMCSRAARERGLPLKPGMMGYSLLSSPIRIRRCAARWICGTHPDCGILCVPPVVVVTGADSLGAYLELSRIPRLTPACPFPGFLPYHGLQPPNKSMPLRKKTKSLRSQSAAAADVPVTAGRQTRSSAAAATVAQTQSNTATSQVPALRRHIRGRLGGLQNMPDMPLDILIEIFKFMHLRDLLNLARTTKGFRAFLMSRKSEPFWRAARRQIEDLPQCPTFLSEPAYANLMFFSHCHGCLKPNIKAVMWEFLVRYCPKCKSDM